MNPFLPTAQPESASVASVKVAPRSGFRPRDLSMYTPSAISPPTVMETDKRGHALLCKYESGVRVVIEDLGSVKNLFNQKLYEASVKTLAELETPPDPNMTAIEVTARNLVLSAVLGEKGANTEFLDRLVGKPKQVTENFTVMRTIDDILNETVFPDKVESAESDVIDITPGEDGTGGDVGGRGGGSETPAPTAITPTEGGCDDD